MSDTLNKNNGVDDLITVIRQAEEPASVTNGMVATVMDHLNTETKKIPEIAGLVSAVTGLQQNVSDLENAAADLTAADTALAGRIYSAVSDIAALSAALQQHTAAYATWRDWLTYSTGSYLRAITPEIVAGDDELSDADIGKIQLVNHGKPPHGSEMVELSTQVIPTCHPNSQGLMTPEMLAKLNAADTASRALGAWASGHGHVSNVTLGRNERTGAVELTVSGWGLDGYTGAEEVLAATALPEANNLQPGLMSPQMVEKLNALHKFYTMDDHISAVSYDISESGRLMLTTLGWQAPDQHPCDPIEPVYMGGVDLPQVCQEHDGVMTPAMLADLQTATGADVRARTAVVVLAGVLDTMPTQFSTTTPTGEVAVYYVRDANVMVATANPGAAQRQFVRVWATAAHYGTQLEAGVAPVSGKLYVVPGGDVYYAGVTGTLEPLYEADLLSAIHPAGPPQAFIDMWNEACSWGNTKKLIGQYNEATGFFELNGITDLTYEEALRIWRRSVHDFRNDAGYDRGSNAGANNKSFLYCRTYFPIVRAAYGGFGEMGRVYCNDSQVEALRFINGYGFGISAYSSVDTFKNCWALHTIHEGLTISKPGSATFYGCFELQNIKLKSTLAGPNWKDCPKLTYESVLYYIENHAATQPVTMVLHPDIYAKIVAEGKSDQWTELLDLAAEHGVTIATV